MGKTERTRGATAPLHNAYRDRHLAATQKSKHCLRSGGKAQSSKEKGGYCMKSSKHEGVYIEDACGVSSPHRQTLREADAETAGGGNNCSLRQHRTKNMLHKMQKQS